MYVCVCLCVCVCVESPCISSFVSAFFSFSFISVEDEENPATLAFQSFGCGQLGRICDVIIFPHLFSPRSGSPLFDEEYEKDIPYRAASISSFSSKSSHVASPSTTGTVFEEAYHFKYCMCIDSTTHTCIDSTYTHVHRFNSHTCIDSTYTHVHRFNSHTCIDSTYTHVHRFNSHTCIDSTTHTCIDSTSTRA